MPRKAKSCRWTLRSGIWQYRLPGAGWKSTGCRDKDEAEQYLREHYGIEAKPKPARRPALTLAAFLEPYYRPGECPYLAYRQSKDQRAIRQFSATHIVRRRAMIDNVILKDAIAAMKLPEIDSAAVEAFQLRLVASGRGPRSTNIAIGTLKTCLSDAARRGLFDRRIIVSNIRYDERQAGLYTAEQIQAMFTDCPGPWQDRTAYTFFLLLATSGCRRSEARALRWHSVDLDTGKIQIVETLREGSTETFHPKWGVSREDVLLPDFTVQRLREHRKECLYVLGDSFVFCGPDGRPYSGTWVTEAFQAMQRAAGCYKDSKGNRLTVHGFRHYYTTLGQQQGLSADAMQAIVGWSNKEVAKRYSHLRAGDYAQVKNIWGHILKKD